MTDTAPARAGARTVKVPEDRDGQRLDNFLLGQLKGAPRSLVYKLVRSGQVRVNGGRARAERKLEAGDEVRIPPLRLETEAERGSPAQGLLQRIEAAIVFEDARLLALDKPSGWPATAAAASPSVPSRPCVPCARARPWNWPTGWTGIPPGCWWWPRSVRPWPSCRR